MPELDARPAMAEPEGVKSSSAAEWRANWKLPLAAMLGYSAGGLQSFAIGPFVTPLREAFGWSMTQVLMGLSVSAFVSIFVATIVGLLVDRLGPRRVGMTGLCITCAAFAMLGTASGTSTNWLILWIFVAIGAAMVQSNVWTSAVVSRFDSGRGLAMAVALSGGALSAAIAPPIAAAFIQLLGWRGGFGAVAFCWLAACLPVIFLFFRGSQDSANAKLPVRDPTRNASGVHFREGVRTRAFFCLVISFGTFAFYSSFMAANLVPLLQERGLGPMAAAGIASVMGVAGIGSRLVVGYLLDRLPGNRIGFVTQMLPLLGCAILLMPSAGLPLFAVAVFTFGVATGAEMDVTLYLASRHFGLRSFGAILGAIMTAGAISATIAPIVTGLVHDRTESYGPILVVIMVLMTFGGIAIAAIGHPKARFAA